MWTEDECEKLWDLGKEYYKLYYIIGRPSDKEIRLAGLTVKEKMHRRIDYGGIITTAYDEIIKLKNEASKTIGKELTEVFFPILDFMTREEFKHYEYLKEKYKIGGYNANIYSFMKHHNKNDFV